MVGQKDIFATTLIEMTPILWLDGSLAFPLEKPSPCAKKQNV
jgi:hypothetical protein